MTEDESVMRIVSRVRGIRFSRVTCGLMAGLLLILLASDLGVCAVSVDEYRSRLDHAIATMQIAARNPDTTVAAGTAQSALQRLADIDSVLLPSGTCVHVNHDSLLQTHKQSLLSPSSRESASRSKNALKAISVTLVLHREELGRVLNGTFQPETRARKWAQAIVSRREFRTQISWVPTLLARILQEAAEFLARHTSTRWVHLLYWSLVGVGVAVVLGIIYYLTRSVRRTLVRDVEQASVPQLSAPDRLRSSEEWHCVAEEYAKRGEFRKAVRALYLGLLMLMDELRLLEYDPNGTNRENLYRLRPASRDLLTSLLRLTHFFESKWYGVGTCVSREYSIYRHEVERISHALRHRALASQQERLAT